jgi:asparagine synthase (glutamine-hydrolysing)
MCGICGIIYFDKHKTVDPGELIQMRDTMIHRGPDDAGYYINNNVGLGHRRLTVLDLSPAGKQPMSNKDGSVWITYNGEFYNYQESKKELKNIGYEFRSTSDTEVILYLYEEYGVEETIRRMNGMFSFCLVDLKEGIEYLVRDRFGIKPLYFTVYNNKLAFASEIKAFLKLRDFKLRFKEELIPEYYLYTRFLDFSTFYDNIYEVKPGSYLEINNNNVQPKVYYDLTNITPISKINESEAIDEVDRLFTKSVERQLISDVPLGVFLSGGLDSSLIAIKMNEILGRPINTISVGYKEKEANEFYWSDQVVRMIKSNHYKYIDNEDTFFEYLPWLTYINDEPLQTGVAFYRAAKHAKQNAKVMLCGQGSDEIFGGYSCYRYGPLQYHINRRINRYVPSSLITLLHKLLPKLGKEKIFRKAGARINLDEIEVAASYASGMPEEDFIKGLKNANYATYRALLRKYELIYPQKDNLDFLNKMMIAEMQNGLQSIVHNTDRMTMAASIETRVPFLDNDLVEFVFSLPTHFKVKNKQGKYLLKKLLAKYFDDTFVYRPKKGFPVPLVQWLLSTNDKFMISDANKDIDAITKYFDIENLNKYKEFVKTRKIKATSDAINPIMRYMSLKIWWRIYWG